MREGDLGLVISSPPYSESLSSDDPEKRGGLFRDPKRANDKTLTATYGESVGQMGVMKESADGFGLAVSSPPFAESLATGAPNKLRPPHDSTGRIAQDVYGDSEGQLGVMKGSPAGFDIALGSPPYADGCAQQGTDHHPERMEGTEYSPARYDLAVASPPFLDARQNTTGSVKGESAPTAHGPEAIGRSSGQLDSMSEGVFDAAVSSPPYEGHTVHGQDGIDWEKTARTHKGRGGEHPKPGRSIEDGYGKSAGQIGNRGEDFWSSARQVVEQTYVVLAPGAHAIWVVKGFIRKGIYVDFPDQWRQLCEAVGFQTLHFHRCWLVEEHGEQHTLIGGVDRIQTQRKSFFRRLHEKKNPDAAIDFEVTLCMVKL